MNALLCEMCTSNNVIKQDGYYVCQNCGTKYSVEEARKIMIEGVVDVSGSTVKVDNSDFVEKCLQNARRAKQKEDWSEMEKYYNLAEQNDPQNIEAIFYSAYAKAKNSLIDSDIYKRQANFKVLQNCISIIDDNFDIEKEEENREIVKAMYDDIIAMACSDYVYNRKVNGYFEVSNDKNETIALIHGMFKAFIDTLENIANKVDHKEDRLFYYEMALKLAESIISKGISVGYPSYYRDKIMYFHRLIKNIGDTHSIPLEAPKPPPAKGGCYVATSVYGSYDCPEVWTLRRFRDYTLAETWYGRVFIHTYYIISPTIVKWFGDTRWFKKLWRRKLDKMVSKLKLKGFEDTPYNDKNW